jgi:Fe-S cluster assembly protein SufD
MINPRQHYVSRYESLRDQLGQLGSSRLHRLRESAIDRFNEIGFPTTQSEEWRYTPLTPLLGIPFEPAARNGVALDELRPLAADLGANRLAFVNGHFEPKLSSLKTLPKGTVLENLSTAFSRSPGLLESHLGQHALHKTSAFTALNTALMEDGAVLRIPAEVTLNEPIHLLFIAASPGTMANPRILIIAGAGAQGAVVEEFLGHCGGPYFTNAVTEVVLERGASLEHFRLQEEAAGAFHVGLVQVAQGRDSQLTSHSFSFGSSLARTEVRTILGEEGGRCSLHGLYMGRGQQHLDNLTSIDHAISHCTSRELYKGVLDQRSSGVFSGRIRVHPDAQRTDASQTNKNLLLSEEALVDTKPQLEIFADDVKCTHGAAVGQLDEDAIFYLQTRGVTKEDARRLLTYAFAREMVELVRLDALKAQIQARVALKLPGAVVAEAA